MKKYVFIIISLILLIPYMYREELIQKHIEYIPMHFSELIYADSLYFYIFHDDIKVKKIKINFQNIYGDEKKEYLQKDLIKDSKIKIYTKKEDEKIIVNDYTKPKYCIKIDLHILNFARVESQTAAGENSRFHAKINYIWLPIIGWQTFFGHY